MGDLIVIYLKNLLRPTFYLNFINVILNIKYTQWHIPGMADTYMARKKC